jgi:hypothetical protein
MRPYWASRRARGQPWRSSPNLHVCAARDLLGPWHAYCFVRNKLPTRLESRGLFWCALAVLSILSAEAAISASADSERSAGAFASTSPLMDGIAQWNVAPSVVIKRRTASPLASTSMTLIGSTILSSTALTLQRLVLRRFRSQHNDKP